ncbi:hypothetical protein [Pseudohaliea rubra]|uniref:General secretion pathway protein N n=1 Tax=Pseudohaliea rubra DSM 19751 TaxID=1265313 RepID=A0A095X1J9_9GAMM|nr:hypothetical protein [Pseudohaliea rubra]KGE04739.1 General secretion pathway protein N [Pseudohaliea rubra DSM 19751]
MKALRARYAGQADPLRSERRVELAAIGLALVLVLVVFYLAVRLAVAGTIRPIEPAPDSVRVASLAAGTVPSPEDRQGITARPLFWAQRQPVEAVEEPAVVVEKAEKVEKAAPRMKNVTVHGVYGSGDAGGVILSLKQRELRVAVGEEVDGWQLERVTGDSAVFLSGGVRDERELVPQVIELPEPQSPAGNADAASPAQDGDRSAAAGRDKDEPRLTLGGAR